jgi:hypothetical protein
MPKWIPDSYLELILDEIKKSDEEAICNAQPSTFFNAVWPDLWLATTAYVVGDVIHPPTVNGFVYECVTAGTSDATEPGWGTTQDAVFADGTVSWKTHENYSLANTPLVPADFTVADGDVDGRKLIVAQKMGAVTHDSGDVTHTALIELATKTLHFVTTAQTTLGGSNYVDSGRSTIFFEFDITIRDPQ